MTSPSVADPLLERLGTSQAGRLQTFWVYGTPGNTATLFLGRSPAICIDANQAMDNLVSHERAFNLGTIPTAGRKKFNLTIPNNFPLGFNLYSQAQTTDSMGTSLLTNSVPVVIRQ